MTDTVRIEALGKKLNDVDPATGTEIHMVKGDRLTVSRQAAELFCGRGWAKDLSGTIATGKRLVRKTVEVQPEDVVEVQGTSDA